MKRQYNLFQQAYLLYVSLLGNCSIQWGLCALYWQTEIEHELFFVTKKITYCFVIEIYHFVFPVTSMMGTDWICLLCPHMTQRGQTRDPLSSPM